MDTENRESETQDAKKPNQVVAWFDGKKTIIGAAVWLVLVPFTLFSGVDIEGFTAPSTWAEYIGASLGVVASLFTGGGLLHKFLKFVANPDYANRKDGDA
jgi:hypothetical protein